MKLCCTTSSFCRLPYVEGEGLPFMEGGSLAMYASGRRVIRAGLSDHTTISTNRIFVGSIACSTNTTTYLLIDISLLIFSTPISLSPSSPSLFYIRFLLLILLRVLLLCYLVRGDVELSIRPSRTAFDFEVANPFLHLNFVVVRGVEEVLGVPNLEVVAAPN